MLILQTDDVEFYLTILLGLAAIAAFPVIYLIVSYALIIRTLEPSKKYTLEYKMMEFHALM